MLWILTATGTETRFKIVPSCRIRADEEILLEQLVELTEKGQELSAKTQGIPSLDFSVGGRVWQE